VLWPHERSTMRRTRHVNYVLPTWIHWGYHRHDGIHEADAILHGTIQLRTFTLDTMTLNSSSLGTLKKTLNFTLSLPNVQISPKSTTSSSSSTFLWWHEKTRRLQKEIFRQGENMQPTHKQNVHISRLCIFFGT